MSASAPQSPTNEWIARDLALGHVTSISRYCSDKVKHSDLPGFTLAPWLCPEDNQS
jgi:hypothetical protein